MIETICPKCQQRYQVGTDHKCPEKSPVLQPSADAPPNDASLAAPAKRGKGRPRSIEDMRAYKAMKQKQYRRDHPEKYGKPARGK